MKIQSNVSVRKLALFTAIALASRVIPVQAAIQQWAPAGVNTNWSNSLNWSPNGSPAGNDLIFTNVSTTAIVTNVVDANFTINSLTVLSNSYTTRLPATLTVNGAGGLTLGDTNGSGNATIIFTNGGGLVVNNANANFVVGPGNANIITITADMSALTNLTATVTNFIVGGAVANTVGRNSGGVLRCPTNTSITASRIAVGDSVPLGAATGLNGGGASTLSLSRVGPNVVNVDTIYIGRGKTSGTLQFNTAGSGGSLTLRNKAGTGPVGTTEVGNRTEANSNSSQTGTVNFDSASVDAQFSTLNIAHSVAAASATTCAGTLTLGSALTGSSLVTVNTLNVTKSDATLAAAGIVTFNGTVNVNGGTLAATNLNLCQLITGTLGTSLLRATLNIGGGTLLFGNTLTPTAGTFVTNNFQYGTIASVDGAARSLPATQVNLGKIGTNALLNFGQSSGGTGALTFGGAVSLQTNVTLQTVQNTTFSGAIDGAFFLVKTGAANLTLNGINTYTGPTTNLAGTLFGVSGGSIVGAVVSAPTTGNSAGVGVVVTNNTMSWTNSGVAFLAGGTGTILNFNYGSTPLSATVPAIQVNGNVDFTATPTVIVQATTLVNGTYALLSWTGSQTGTAPTAVSLPPRVTGNLSISGNTLYLNVTGNTGPVRWASGNGTWDINNVGNNTWVNNASSPTYYQEQFGVGDVVQLDDTATTGTPTLTLGTTATPNGLTVNSTKNYSVNGGGKIAGIFALTKSGSGSLTLGTANSYSGGTVLNQGQLNINHGGSGVTSSAIGIGALTINGGTLDNTSGADVTVQAPIVQNWNADLTYLGSANSLNLGAGAVAVTPSITNQNVTVGSNTLTIGGNLGPSTNYSLTKLGGGTLALGGVSSLTGPVLVQEGAVQAVGGNNRLNPVADVQLGYTNTTAKLILGNSSSPANQTLMSLTVSTNCPLVGNRVVGGNAALSTLTLSNAFNVPLNFNDSIGGPGANENNLTLTKANTGGYGLGGTNTYTGVTRINSGVLDFRIKGALYNGDTNSWTTTNIIVSSGAVLGLGIGGANYFSPADVEFFKTFGTTNGGLQNGAVLGLDPAGGDYTYGGVISDIITPSGTTNLLGLTALNSNVVSITATNTYTGGTFAGFGGTLRVAGAGALQQNKNLTLGAFGGAGTFQYDSTAESTFANANFGNGTLAIGNYNQSAGTVNVPGTMKLGQGNSSSFYGTVNVSGGNLNVNSLFNGYAAQSPNSVTVSGTGSLVVSNGYSVGVTGGDARNSRGLLTQNGGSITVAGGMMLARYDNTRIRTSTNDLNGGTLNVDFITAEATDGSFPTTNVAVLNLNGGTIKATAGGTIISGLTSVNVKTNGAIIDDGGNSVTIGQALLDDGTQVGGLTKLGVGTLTLPSDNTYYGATVVSNGTLAITTGSISNSAAINIAGGATFDVSAAPSFVVQTAQTLKGNGTVNGSLTNNGTLAPGASVGTLTFNNNLTINGNLAFELNKSLSPSNDIAVVTGVLTNAGTGTLTVSNLGPALSVGDKFTLFSQPLLNGNALIIVPPSGVTLTNKLAVDGSIQVLTASSIASYSTNITSSVSGNTLTVSWPTTHLGWILQNQTNALTVGLATNWVDIAGTASVTSTNLTISPAKPTEFFRLRHP